MTKTLDVLLFQCPTTFKPNHQMNCPNCDSREIRVLTSKRDTNESILRRRRCGDCGHNWWTVEVELPLGSIKWMKAPDLGDNSYRPRYPSRLPGAKRVTFS
jgi:transposase-like protein